jgi:hypothetical protein
MKTASAFHTRNLSAAFALSSVVAGMLAALSLARLLFPGSLYPTDDLRRASIPTDVVNLVIGLPVLLGAMALARRGNMLGLLFWPGMLLFVIYHAVAFAVMSVCCFVPFGLFVHGVRQAEAEGSS